MNGKLELVESQYFQSNITKILYTVRHVVCRINDPLIEDAASVRYFKILYMYNEFVDTWMEVDFEIVSHLNMSAINDRDRYKRDIPKNFNSAEEFTCLDEDSMTKEYDKIKMLRGLCK